MDSSRYTSLSLGAAKNVNDSPLGLRSNAPALLHQTDLSCSWRAQRILGALSCVIMLLSSGEMLAQSDAPAAQAPAGVLTISTPTPRRLIPPRAMPQQSLRRHRQFDVGNLPKNWGGRDLDAAPG